MARTAITTAIRHDGKEVLVHGRQVSILEQLQNWRNTRCELSHPDIAEVHYQESDGQLLIHRMRTLEAQADHVKKRNAETASNAATVKVEIAKEKKIKEAEKTKSES